MRWNCLGWSTRSFVTNCKKTHYTFFPFVKTEFSYNKNCNLFFHEFLFRFNAGRHPQNRSGFESNFLRFYVTFHFFFCDTSWQISSLRIIIDKGLKLEFSRIWLAEFRNGSETRPIKNEIMVCIRQLIYHSDHLKTEKFDHIKYVLM